MPDSQSTSKDKPADNLSQMKASEQSTQASREAAQSVAEAVKRVADAAVAEVQKQQQPATREYDFVIRGSAGGKFVARSDTKFGTGGDLRLNGKSLHTTAWGAMIIEGDLPSDASRGEAIADMGNGHCITGIYFG